jgi:hypothetical protein
MVLAHSRAAALARRPSASIYSGDDGRLRLEGFYVVDVVEGHVIAQSRDPLRKSFVCGRSLFFTASAYDGNSTT